MTDQAMKPLVRIVDDEPGVLESLAFLLRSEGYETAGYASAAAFLREDAPSRPGCLILDVRMPEMSGLELQYILNARHIWIPVIFLTAHGDVDMAVGAMHEGAFDFQQKPLNPQKMLASVSRAIHADMKRRGLVTEARSEPIASVLTDREREVLTLAAQGLTSREIGERLEISRRTAEHYRAFGMKKLGCASIAELALLLERESAGEEG